MYAEWNLDALKAEQSRLLEEYEALKAEGLSLDLSRGKPGKKQLDMLEGMLSCVATGKDCRCEDGLDCRNYGVLGGIPEAKRMFSELLDIPRKTFSSAVTRP